MEASTFMKHEAIQWNWNKKMTIYWKFPLFCVIRLMKLFTNFPKPDCKSVWFVNLRYLSPNFLWKIYVCIVRRSFDWQKVSVNEESFMLNVLMSFLSLSCYTLFLSFHLKMIFKNRPRRYDYNDSNQHGDCQTWVIFQMMRANKGNQRHLLYHIKLTRWQKLKLVLLSWPVPQKIISWMFQVARNTNKKAI